MHVESLDPRTFFYAGVDTTFGTDGRVELTIDGNPHAIAGTQDSIYVSYDGVRDVNSFATLSARGKYIAGRLGGETSDSGTVERVLPIGDSGAYTIGATNVAATANASGTHYLTVASRTAVGELDKNFGVNGKFVYDLSDAPVTDLKFVDAVQTADGGLVIALDRNSVARDDFDLSEVVLLKLTASGVRDKSFGVKGITVAFATITDFTIDADYTPTDALAGSDLTLNDDGTLRVLFSRTSGDRLTNSNGTSRGVNADYQIKSRTFTADGGVVQGLTSTWDLVEKNATPGTNNRFAPLLIADDGPTRVTVIGRERVGDAVKRPFAYTLLSGSTVTASPFATGTSTASQVMRSDTGKYFALLRGNAVARLDDDFTLDATFGTGGVAKLDTRNLRYTFSPQLFAVPGDRVIVPLLIDGPVDAVLYLTRLG